MQSEKSVKRICEEENLKKENPNMEGKPLDSIV